MASDESKKSDSHLPDPFGGVDDEGWDSVLDDLFDGLSDEPSDDESSEDASEQAKAKPAASAPQKPAPLPSATREAIADASAIDPMMALVQEGEIEIDETKGAALGSLLGVEAESAASGPREGAARFEDETPASTIKPPLEAVPTGEELLSADFVSRTEEVLTDEHGLVEGESTQVAGEPLLPLLTPVSTVEGSAEQEEKDEATAVVDFANLPDDIAAAAGIASGSAAAADDLASLAFDAGDIDDDDDAGGDEAGLAAIDDDMPALDRALPSTREQGLKQVGTATEVAGETELGALPSMTTDELLSRGLPGDADEPPEIESRTMVDPVDDTLPGRQAPEETRQASAEANGPPSAGDEPAASEPPSEADAAAFAKVKVRKRRITVVEKRSRDAVKDPAETLNASADDLLRELGPPVDVPSEGELSAGAILGGAPSSTAQPAKPSKAGSPFEGLESGPPQEQPAAPPEFAESALCLEASLQSPLEAERPAESIDVELADLALELLANAATSANTTTYAADLELARADLLDEIGRAEEARQSYRDVLAHRPRDVFAHLALQRHHAANSEPAEVAALCGALAEGLTGASQRALQLTQAEFLWARGGDDMTGRDLVCDTPVTAVREVLLKVDLAFATGDRDEQQQALAALVRAIDDPRQDAEIVCALRHERAWLLEADGAHGPALDEFAASLQPELTSSDEQQQQQSSGSEHVRSEVEQASVWLGRMRAALAQNKKDAMQEALSALGHTAGSSGVRRQKIALAAAAVATGAPAETLVSELMEIVAEEGADLSASIMLAELQRAAGESSSAASHLAELSRSFSQPAHRVAFLCEAARCVSRSDYDEADDYYERALGLDENAFWAKMERFQLNREHPDVERRLAVWTAAFEKESDAKRRAFCALTAAQLTGADGVIERLSEAVSADPDIDYAACRLNALLQKAGDSSRRSEMLEALVRDSGSNEKRAFWQMQRGQLLEWSDSDIADAEEAARCYGDVVEGLGAQHYAAMALRRVVASRSARDELLAVLEQHAGLADGATAADLWCWHGDVLGADGRWTEAADSYARAADLAGEGSLALWGGPLWGLLFARAHEQNWPDAVESLGRLVDLAPADGGLAKALSLRVGQLREGPLDDAAGSLVAYEMAASEPNPAPGAKKALQRARRRYLDAEQAADELRARIESESEDDHRYAYRIALGELLSRSGTDWNDAEEQFRRALDIRDDHPVARRALETLYQARGAWQALSDLAFSHLTNVEHPQVRVMVYERLAERDFSRGDQLSASLSYDSVLEQNPQDVHALRFLKRRYTTERRFKELAIVARQEVEQGADDPSERLALALELAHLLTRYPILQLPSTEASDDEQEAVGEPALVADADSDERAMPTAYEVLERIGSEEASASAAERALATSIALRLAQQDDSAERLSDIYLGHAQRVSETGAATDAALLRGHAATLRDDDIELLEQAVKDAPRHLGLLRLLLDSALRKQRFAAACDASERQAKLLRDADQLFFSRMLAADLAWKSCRMRRVLSTTSRPPCLCARTV
jgi:tetratricopeptide (TPR) repeat protein